MEEPVQIDIKVLKERYREQFMGEMHGLSTIEEVSVFKPDAVLVLGGDITKKERGSKIFYDLAGLTEGDTHGVTGGKARFIAGVRIYKYIFKKAEEKVRMLTTGTHTGLYPDGPLEADVGAQFLQRHGVPEETIIKMKEPFTTLQEFISLAKVAHENNFKKIVVVTNGYHIPRARAFYETLADEALYGERLRNIDDKLNEYFGSLSLTKKEFFEKIKNLQVEFVAAEDILKNISHYENIIEKFFKTDGYQKRVESELGGYAQLKEGLYGTKVS